MFHHFPVHTDWYEAFSRLKWEIVVTATVVLRLVESGVITEEKARNLYQEKSESIAIRIELTGKAEQWQQNSGSLLRYGSLLDNLAFNSEHELLVDSREESDRAYLEKIGKEFRNRK